MFLAGTRLTWAPSLKKSPKNTAMAAADEEKGMKVNESEMINGYDGNSEFAYLRPADPSFWEKLWQTLEAIATKSDSSPGSPNDGFDEGFETWVHNRYKKRILYRYNKDFVLDMAALESICVQFRLKRISEQAFNIITSTPKEIGLICEKLDEELQGYTAALRDMEYMDNFGLTSNIKDPFTITTETTSQQAMLKEIWKNLLHTGSADQGAARNGKQVSQRPPSSELDESPEIAKKQALGRLLRFEQESIPEPRNRENEYMISQEPDHRFRKKALHKYFEVFVWAVVGNLFLIGPMILMVLKPGLVTSLVTTSVCVTIFAAVAPKFLDKIGDVMSATAAYAAVLVVFVGTSGGGSSV